MLGCVDICTFNEPRMFFSWGWIQKASARCFCKRPRLTFQKPEGPLKPSVIDGTRLCYGWFMFHHYPTTAYTTDKNNPTKIRLNGANLFRITIFICQSVIVTCIQMAEIFENTKKGQSCYRGWGKREHENFMKLGESVHLKHPPSLFFGRKFNACFVIY